MPLMGYKYRKTNNKALDNHTQKLYTFQEELLKKSKVL
jgi:hypothetical protein